MESIEKTMFRVSNSTWDNSIQEKIVIRTTDKSVWFNFTWYSGTEIRRELKRTNDYAWFDTRVEAFDFIKDKLTREIKYKEIELRLSTDRLVEFYEKYKDIKRSLILNEILID